MSVYLQHASVISEINHGL